MPTFAVLGSGGWGTAIAVVLARRAGNRVRLWSARPESFRSLSERRENVGQLPGVPIPPEVELTADPAAAAADADCWVFAVPTAFLRTSAGRFAPLARKDVPVVSLTKGIEADTFRRPSQVLADVLGMNRVVVVSGPSHAEEVARGMPTSVVAASPDAGLAGWVQERLGGERLRVYTNTDLIGVELAGALKNVIGIAAGICDGLRFGDNAKAALLTRGLVEMRRFAVAHAADPVTFDGLAGVGDLITTCFSPHGRNRRLGERIARGESLAEVTAGPQVAEGAYTARSVHERVTRTGLEVPIMTAVYEVLYEGKSPAEAVAALLSRRQRGENFYEGLSRERGRLGRFFVKPKSGRDGRAPGRRVMLNVAFKEWAAVCRALADGRQSLILRKGGIAEEHGEFRPERPRFWLYPTFFHAQEAGLVSDAVPLVASALADRPPDGTHRLSHFAEVSAVHFADTLESALALEGLHVWSADTVRQRFHYRNPGLYVLTVRVFRCEAPTTVPEHPAYAGCKTWVELIPGAEEQPAAPVITDAAFAELQAQISRRIANG